MYLHLPVMISVRSLFGYTVIANKLNRNKAFLAITDKPISPLNFATNVNPDYWLNKEQSKGNFLKECKFRGNGYCRVVDVSQQ